MSESERSQLRDGVLNHYDRYTRLQRGMLVMMLIGAVLFVVGLIVGLAALIISKRHSEVSKFSVSQDQFSRSFIHEFPGAIYSITVCQF
jgi:Ca2+/Na+ antiporter